MKILLTDESRILKTWMARLKTATRFQIAMALISESGLDHFAELLDGRLKAGAVGQVLVGTDLPTSPEALARLIQIQQRHPGNFELRRYQPAGDSVFHPKIALFRDSRERAVGIVGSSNLTNGGLAQNVEVNVLVDDASETRLLEKFFVVHWLSSRAKPVSAAWLAAYRKAWARRSRAMRVLARSRVTVAKIKSPRMSTRPLPTRVKDSTFVFTGALGNGWNRDEVLRRVHHLGGFALDSAAAVKGADCLVEGRINSYYDTTRKLEMARQTDTPIMPAEDFIRLVSREVRLKRGKS